MNFFNTYESHPVPAILTLNLPKQVSSQIPCLKSLIQSSSFHTFSKEELNSLYGLLSNGQNLSVLKNEFSFRTEITINDIQPILAIANFPDQLTLDIAAFFVLRGAITWLTQPIDSFQVSPFLKLLNLINFVLSSSQSRTLKLTFVYVLHIATKKIKESFLEEVLTPITQFIEKCGSELPPQIVDAMSFLVCAITSQVQTLSETDSSLFKITGKLINSFSQKDFNSIREPLISGLSPFLKKFEPAAYSFLAQIISIFPFNDIRPIVLPMPAGIVEFIENTKTYYPVPDITSLPEPLVVEFGSNQRFPFITMDTFKEGVNMKFPQVAAERKKITTCFPPNIIDILKSTYNIARSKDVQEFFATSFIKLINENSDNEKLFDIILIALSICRDIELEKVILKSRLFDPRVNTFTYNSEHDVFFTVRSFVFRLLLRILPICEEFIEPLIQQPLIIADIFHYLADDVTIVSPSIGKNESFITFLGKIAGMYQTANVEMTDHIKEIEFARVSIVKFTLNLLKVHESANSLVTTILYCQMLFSYLYENALRPHVLKSIQGACASNDLDLSFCVSDFFYNVFENVKEKEFKQEIIKAVNGIIESNSDYKQYFMNCVAPLMEDLKSLENNEASKQYLLDVIHFVSDASNNFHVSHSNTILETIQRVEGDEPSEEIYKELLSFIAGEKIKDIAPTFTIKHPNILTLFLMAFRKSQRFIPTLKLLKDLCFNCRENAIACQQGNLDILLIDLLYQYKNNTESEEIAPAMSLFTHIASVSSSPEAVRKYFSLFAQVSPGVVSSIQPFFFTTLSDLVSIEEYKPFSYLPLTQNSPVISVNGIYGRQLSTGFTIVLWIYADQNPLSSPKFFSITNENRKGYELFIKSNALFIKINGEGEKTLNIGNVVSNKWINVSLSFVNDNNKLNLISCVDQIVGAPIEAEWIDIDKAQITAIFGGSSSGTLSILEKSALGPFGIFPFLKSNVMIQIAQKNLRSKPELKSLFYVDVKTVDKKLSINTTGVKGITAKIVGPELIMPLTFSQCLIEYCSITVLLPLLNQLDSVMQDKPQPSSTISMVVKLLHSLLEFQPQAQVLFFEANGVRALTHLLTNSNEKHIDYMLYQSILPLYEMLTFEPLKNEIFEKILLNLEIWVLANGLSQLQISRHWSRELFTQHIETVRKFLSFQRLLMLLRIFYWYTPVEKNIAYTKRASDIPVNDVRQNLLQILHSFATHHFSAADFSALIGHCVSCADPLQVSDLLSFLKLLAVSPESPIQFVQDVWYQFTSLHSLIHNKDEIAVFSVVDVFMALHYLRLINEPKVTRHVNILMDVIPSNVLTNNFFVKILPLAKKYPDFMPIIFYLAMVLGEDEMKIIKDNLTPSKSYSEPKHWALLPLLTAFKYGQDSSFLHFIMRFLAGCADDKWDQAFAQIDLAARVLNIDASEAKSVFLIEICERIYTTQALFQFELLHTFLDVAIFHLFFRPIDEMNTSLHYEFINSPFSDEVQPQSELPLFTKEICKNKFYEKLKDFNMTKQTYKFGLRFDKKGHWLDQELGNQVIKLAMKTKSQTFHNVTALVLAFLYHETPDSETKELIDRLIKKNVVDPPFADLLKRMAIDPKRKVSDCCFEKFIKDSLSLFEGMECYINDLAGRLQRFFEKCENAKKEIFEKGDNGLQTQNQQSVFNEICLEAHRRNLFSKEWRILLRVLTFDRFPWHSARDDQGDILIRDSTLSEFNCPVQWKFRNPNKKKANMKKPRPIRRLQNERRAETMPVVGKVLETAETFSDIKDEITNIPGRLLKFGNPSGTFKFTIEGTKISLIFDDHTRDFTNIDITQIEFKPVLHHPTGIEITTSDRKSYLLNFSLHNSLSILKVLAAQIEFKNVPIQTQTMIAHFKSQDPTQKWLNGEYSNFEYLMLINKLSGRTFNFESMYPIMPWVVKQFGSDLDIKNEDTFRDLSKPMNTNEPVSTVNAVLRYLKKCEPFASLPLVENGKNYPEFTSIPQAFAENDGRELTPEFYFASEFFKGITLPEWASTPTEFVYKNRKALESKYVTEHLNEWIDIIWGRNQKIMELNPMYYETIWDAQTMKNLNKRSEIETFKRINGQVPPQLFKEAHPKKTYTERNPGVVCAHCYKGDGIHKPIYAVLESIEEKTFSFTCINQDNTIYSVKIDAEKQLSATRDTYATFKGDVFALYANHIVGIGQKGELKIGRDSGEAMEIAGHHAKGTCIACSQPFIVVGGADSSLALYRSLEFVKVIPTFSAEITCCDVISSFGLIAAGTADRSIFILSAKDGTPRSCINTNNVVPKKVMITKKWGFVVMYGEIGPKKSVVDVYTIQGELIRRKEISFTINSWTTFSSRDDFDYVVAADGNGKLYLFEAFYANFGDSFYDTSNHITHLVFSSETAVTFAFADNGDIYMAPCHIPT